MWMASNTSPMRPSSPQGLRYPALPGPTAEPLALLPAMGLTIYTTTQSPQLSLYTPH